jgi:hypothetical protein
MARYQKGQTGNADGRPVGAKNKRTLIRDALEKVYDGGEGGFWLAVAGKAKEGDSAAISMLGARLVAPLRACDSAVYLEGLDGGSLMDKAEKIVASMGVGAISPSEAAAMVGAIATLCRVQETEELADRIAALEDRRKLS